MTGLKKETFLSAVEILKTAETNKMKLGGRPPKILMEDRLLIACEYWREYRTYEHIAAIFSTTKSTVHRIIVWIEDTLVKSGKFSLPGKKSLAKSDVEWEVILVDTSETPIQRPSKRQKRYYSGKKNDTH